MSRPSSCDHSGDNEHEGTPGGREQHRGIFMPASFASSLARNSCILTKPATTILSRPRLYFTMTIVDGGSSHSQSQAVRQIQYTENVAHNDLSLRIQRQREFVFHLALPNLVIPFVAYAGEDTAAQRSAMNTTQSGWVYHRTPTSR